MDAYWSGRGGDAGGETKPVDADAIERTLAALYARGRAAHPDLDVEDAAFAAHLGCCGAAVDGQRADDVHAEDLYLCCSGLLGDEAAVRTLRQCHRPVLASHLRGIDGSPAFVEEVEQRFWDTALIGSVDAPARLASYSGRGPLGSWVGVAAQRIALMIRRREAAERRALDRVGVEARLATKDRKSVV